MLAQILSKGHFCFARFILKQGQYLVPSPPPTFKKLSGWDLFTKEMRGKFKDTQGSQSSIIQIISQDWSSNPALQKEYNDKAEKMFEEPQKAKDEYEEKYQIPFKRITPHNLMVRHIAKEKLIQFSEEKDGKKVDIAERGKKQQEYIKNNIPEAKKKIFAQEAEKINEQRDKLKQPFQIPPKKYPSEGNYITKHGPDGERKRWPVGVVEKLKQGYKEYMESWKKEVEEWLKKLGADMTYEDLEKLIQEQKEMEEKQKKQSKDLDKQIKALKAQKKAQQMANARIQEATNAQPQK